MAFAGVTGGMRTSDTLLLRIPRPADETALVDAGRVVETCAQALRDGGSDRAAWSDEGGSGSWKPRGNTPCSAPLAGSPVPSPW